MGGWPKDHEARDCIKVLTAEFGWTYNPAGGGRAHPAGYLLCKQAGRDGCRINVASTGNNTARKTWTIARRCQHGCAPLRKHW